MMTWMVAALAVTQTPIPEFGPELARRLDSGAPVIDFGGQTYRISSPVITRGLNRRHIRNLKLVDATRPPASVPDYFISHPTVAWGMMNARDVVLENVQLERPAWMGLGFIGGSNVTLRRVSVTGGQGGRHPRHHVVVNRLTNLTIEDSRFVAGPQHDGELVGVGTGVPVHFRPNANGELEAIEPHWRLETNFPAWIGTPDEVRLVRASGGRTLTIRYAGLSEVEGPADRHPLRWQVFWPGMDPTWSVRPIQRDSRAKTMTLALRGTRDATFPEGWVTWAAWNPAGMVRQHHRTGQPREWKPRGLQPVRVCRPSPGNCFRTERRSAGVCSARVAGGVRECFVRGTGDGGGHGSARRHASTPAGRVGDRVVSIGQRERSAACAPIS
jgi:hypothetical protein